jgi:hypothetical protein
VRLIAGYDRHEDSKTGGPTRLESRRTSMTEKEKT